MAKFYGTEVTNEEYISLWGALALERYESSKILPSLPICQAILESGWGCSLLAVEHGNYHALNWYNDLVTKKYAHWTYNNAPQEYNGVTYYQSEEFCEFKTADEELDCLYDWYNRNNAYYKALHGEENAYTNFELIKKAGYATSSAYTKSLTQIYDLYPSIRKYDELALSGKEITIMTNLEFADRIKELYKNRAKWTYMYESTGLIVGTDAKVKNYFDYFKNIGWIKEQFNWETWSKQNNGKQCTDCSNTMNYVLFGKGAASYYSSNAPKTWPQVDKKYPVVGAVAWKEGHVGYITKVENNLVTFVDMPSMGNTFREWTSVIGEDTYWTGYAKCPKIQYVTGEPKSISVKLLKEFKVGDTFTAKDATITVECTDGSKLINPAYWTATPLKISKLPMEMTFAYKNVSTKVMIGKTKEYTITIDEQDLAKFKELFPHSKYKEI